MARNIASKLATGTAAFGMALGSIFGTPGTAQAQDATPTSMQPQEETVERVPASEAFQRSEGQIVFMDAGNLVWVDIDHIEDVLNNFQEQTGISFEIISVRAEDTNDESFLCFNAQNCYPITEENLGVALASINDAAELNGLSTTDLAALDLD